MDTSQKYWIGIGVCIALAGLTVVTIIGPVIFGLLALGLFVKLKEHQHGERPWWAKSMVTHWRERKSGD